MDPARQAAKQTAPATARPAPAAAAVAKPSSGAALRSRIGNAGLRGAIGQGQAKDEPAHGKGSGKAAAKPALKLVDGKDKGGAAGSAQAQAAAPGAEAGAAAAGPVAAVALQMPEPPNRPSPATLKRIAGVRSRAGETASAQASLPDADKQVGSARSAVVPPEAERAAEAQAQLIAQMNAAPSPEIDKLCERIREVIRKKRPPDEDALAAAEPAAEAMDAGNQLNQTVQGEAGKVQQNYEGLNTPPAVPGAPENPGLAPQPAAVSTAPLAAKAATPDAVPAKDVSLDKDAADSKAKIQQAGMEEPSAQLVQNGPIAEARAAQGELDQTAQESPAQVLAKQKETLAAAQGDMASLGADALAALTASRDASVQKIEGRQAGMVVSEEQMRIDAGNAAQKAFNEARGQVEGLLKNLPEKAMAEWDAAKAIYVGDFKADLKIVEDRVKERHSGVSGFVVGLWDAVTGLPGWAEDAYSKAEKRFGDSVIVKLREISTKVNAVILACEKIISDTRAKIKGIYDKLPDSMQLWAAGEQAKFSSQLDKLQQQAQATRDTFNKGLVQQAALAVDEVRAEIAELRKKAGGLIGRIAAAVERFLDDPVKFIIDGLLELVGIPPASFWALIAKIKKVASDIADDPERFANNLLKGLGQGFSQFFDNFGTHLIRGFLTWLLGDLKGVQVPKDLSLKSIATFFLQLMGITWPNIREILARKIGAKNVALIEKAYSILSLLIEKGPEGIYEMIRERLDPQAIVDQVIEMAVEYMVTAIAKNVAARLLLLFNPVGAIVQAIEAIYRVLKWVFQNAARIFRLIEAVVNGLADIIAGNVGGFANAVEKALGMLIAPVISFIADYCNLGDLPQTVAKQIKSFQKMVLGFVEKAIDWIIDKGKALLAAVGIGGKKDEKKGGEEFDGQIGEKVRWTAEDELHTLWIEDGASGPVVMMASEKGPVLKQLDNYATKVKTLKGSNAKERKQRAEDAIAEARTILASTTASARATKQESAKANADPKTVAAKDDETEAWEDKLWPQLQIIQIALQLIPLPTKPIILGGGAKASSVSASQISIKGSGGSKPRGKLLGWDHVMQIDRQLLNPKKGQWGPAYWVAGHLVSEQLHGPGDPWNTVPIRKADNSKMRADIESDAIGRIENEEVIYYNASVEFHSGDIVENFPSLISIEWGSMRYKNKQWETGDAYRPFELSKIDPPPLDATTALDLNETRRAGLYKLGVPIRFAMAIDDERANGKFTYANFATRMTAAYAIRGGDASANLAAGLAAISGLIADEKLRIGDAK